MDKGILQRYSTWAKVNLENQIEVSLKSLGINGDDDIKKAKLVGDVMTIEGDPTSYPAGMFGKRKDIIDLVTRNGYRNVIEEFAYTWFNRFVALRFMEVHGFLDHGFRVLSNTSGGIEPEILKNINLVKDELRLDINLCNEYKQQGKLEELFRHVLIKQCNVLSGILPMLFSSDLGYLELLLPKTLLKGETVITRLVEISEDAFLEDVEIIGWMYQFYISSKKDEVYASKKTITKDTLPAVTQLFTPDWIVRYMAENSVGRLWLESYPDSSLRSEMKYYVEDAEQTEEVRKKIDEIKYKNVNPEEIRIIEPCCGSGHILVYVFDLLYKMYEERGYQKRDIPTLILKNNLVGLDVDKRAAQLASFALIMKARSVNNRFFNKEYYESPHVYELQDSKLLIEQGYRKCLRDLNLLGEEEICQIDYIVKIFENGKTIGSLLKVELIDFARLEMNLNKISENAVSNLFNMEFLNAGIKRLRILIEQAKVLSAKYDVMITNPPYRPISSMEEVVSEYANNVYPKSKTDMYAMFMETDFVKNNGFLAMINMQSWMFLSSFEKLRSSILKKYNIINMLHLGARAFEEISGEVVQTTSFIIRNNETINWSGVFYRLSEEATASDKKKAFETRKRKFISEPQLYAHTPFKMILYWLNQEQIDLFNENKLEKYVDIKQGAATSDNNRFLKLWHEVSINKIGFGCSRNEALKSEKKWFPYNKGGTPIKWYGNQDYIVNYYKDGQEMKAFHEMLNKDHPGGRLKNQDYYFREGFTWSTLSNTFSVRYCPKGFIFDTKGSMGFASSSKEGIYFIGLLNSIVGQYWMKILAPTLDFNPIALRQVPVKMKNDESILKLVYRCIDIAKENWDSYEISWDFQNHPLNRNCTFVFEAYNCWEKECHKRYVEMKENEEKLNRFFIEMYGLNCELVPETEKKEYEIYFADKEKDVRSLVSYLVGIAMGRYSLDIPGIAYAGDEWDSSKYVSYQPDDDGIIPIYAGIGMEDGLTTVLINLIKQIYGEETYRQNIDFIAEALGKNNNESPEETLNRYLNDEFYADHLKIYQKRPIYWLFTSGKKAGFKCLIYMHRYNEDTLARINAKYFLPETTRKKNELEDLNGRIVHAEGRDKLRLEKDYQNLAAAHNEAIEYGQVLDHMANRYISINLDDGVKENYAKFQGIEIVTDGGSKVKKDLLAPLK
ncbi:MAG: BREX-1 system adenine-specific DNA-methyltransferase PglX [Lachnospiraceae bacterium]|nr:BREX-1 system adenine-specific DNA-methyltransferase PglX [Lachnospiraceae bacterium]